MLLIVPLRAMASLTQAEKKSLAGLLVNENGELNPKAMMKFAEVMTNAAGAKVAGEAGRASVDVKASEKFDGKKLIEAYKKENLTEACKGEEDEPDKEQETSEEWEKAEAQAEPEAKAEPEVNQGFRIEEVSMQFMMSFMSLLAFSKDPGRAVHMHQVHPIEKKQQF